MKTASKRPRRIGIGVLYLAFSVAVHPTPCLTQTDGTLRSFFPLHVGDYWEYLDDEVPTPFLHLNVKVIADTIMPNNKVYRIFREAEFRFPDDPYYSFYRIDDSLRVYRYSQES